MGYILVDVNGSNRPNRLGTDYFGFLATKYGMYPAGLKEATSSCGNVASHCNKNNENISNGLGCTNWVITNGNMDYLKKRISW